MPSATDLVKLLAIRTTLVTSAESDLRAPYLEYMSELGQAYATITSGGRLGESKTATITFGQGASRTGEGELPEDGLTTASLLDLWLMPGDKVKLGVFQIDAEDQLGETIFRYLIGHEWADLQWEERVAAAVGL